MEWYVMLCWISLTEWSTIRAKWKLFAYSVTFEFSFSHTFPFHSWTFTHTHTQYTICIIYIVFHAHHFALASSQKLIPQYVCGEALVPHQSLDGARLDLLHLCMWWIKECRRARVLRTLNWFTRHIHRFDQAIRWKRKEKWWLGWEEQR